MAQIVTDKLEESFGDDQEDIAAGNAGGTPQPLTQPQVRERIAVCFVSSLLMSWIIWCV